MGGSSHRGSGCLSPGAVEFPGARREDSAFHPALSSFSSVPESSAAADVSKQFLEPTQSLNSGRKSAEKHKPERQKRAAPPSGSAAGAPVLVAALAGSHKGQRCQLAGLTSFPLQLGENAAAFWFGGIDGEGRSGDAAGLCSWGPAMPRGGNITSLCFWRTHLLPDGSFSPESATKCSHRLEFQNGPRKTPASCPFTKQPCPM